jgi:hypothetical protein
MNTGALAWTVLSGALLGFAAMHPAAAGDYDGSKPLICAALTGISCAANGQCRQDTVENLNLPQFFWIDATARTVGEKGADGQIRTASLQTSAQSTTHLILQGTTDRLGWSATISKVSGKLMMTEADGAAAQVIFGACTPAR